MGFFNPTPEERQVRTLEALGASVGVYVSCKKNKVETFGINKVSVPIKGSTATLETGEEMTSRITATRVLLIGVFALAAPKKEGGNLYLTITNGDDVLVEEVKRKKGVEARNFIAAFNKYAQAQ